METFQSRWRCCRFRISRLEISSTSNASPSKAVGVQGVYKQAVLTYYRRGDATSLHGKHAWIDAKLKDGVA